MIKTISKYIALKRIVEEVKTGFGLALTAKEAADQRYQKGLIVSVGDEITNIKAGDTVLYDKSNSYSMLIEGEEITIIQFREVAAIF
jgi:co-chaperonin GroES (HSP10)